MCGILGFLTDKPNKENAKYFKKILYMSDSRGKEATGIFYTKDDIFSIVKQPVSSPEFIKDIFPKHVKMIENAKIALGHTRSPTQGSPKDNDNNHPIESENWILIHNGGVTKMPRLDGYKYKGEVDSEILISYIEKYGLKEGLPYVERGSAAVALIDKRDLNSVYLWREANPIILACDTKSNTIFFASQKEFLERGLANKFLLFTSFQIRELPANLLIKITINPFAVISMGYVEVMKYTPAKYTYTPYTPPAKESQWKDTPLEFNSTTLRWELPLKKEGVAGDCGIPFRNKYLRDHGFTDSEIDRMTPAAISTIMYNSYNGTDVAITQAGSVQVLSKSSPHVESKLETKHDINKCYIGGMSKDFRNWIKLTKPNKGHISIDGELIKKWDDVRKSHYIMTVEEAVKERLIDITILQADIDELSSSDLMGTEYVDMEE
jgi:predicted glutamine amidotransferase